MIRGPPKALLDSGSWLQYPWVSHKAPADLLISFIPFIEPWKSSKRVGFCWLEVTTCGDRSCPGWRFRVALAANLDPLSNGRGLRIPARYWVRTLWRRGPHHPARICRRDSACIPADLFLCRRVWGIFLSVIFGLVFVLGARSLDQSYSSLFALNILCAGFSLPSSGP
jgi:hypothetical protein